MQLKFKNYDHHGVGTTNVTVRRGYRDHYKRGEQFEFGNLKGEILGLFQCPFWAIPEPYIEWEHDPKCRTRQGLLRTMQELYSVFDEKEVVTCVLFRVLHAF